MRVWDEELLTRKGGLQPVTDGLLFWLDGQDELIGDTEYRPGQYSPPIYAASHMFDRVSGARVDFAQIKTSGGIQSDGLKLFLAAPFGNGGQVGTLTSAIAGVKAIEITFAAVKVGYTAAQGTVIGDSRVFFPIRSTTTGAVIADATAIKNAPAHLVFQGNTSNGKPVIYQNGVIASVTGASASVVQAINVSTLITADQYTSIGSIRLYNRSLSDAEIQNNLEYEISTGRVVL